MLGEVESNDLVHAGSREGISDDGRRRVFRAAAAEYFARAAARDRDAGGGRAEDTYVLGLQEAELGAQACTAYEFSFTPGRSQQAAHVTTQLIEAPKVQFVPKRWSAFARPPRRS